MRYRRPQWKGGTFFFTVVTHDRRPFLCEPENIGLLREVFRKVMAAHPFTIDAIVIMPDHIHALWTLPAEDGDFSRRWKQGNILPDEVHQLADQLEAEGGKEYALQCANELTEKALDCLHCTNPKGEAGEALIELANKLLKRET